MSAFDRRKELLIWIVPDVHWWDFNRHPAPGTLVISNGCLQNGQHGFSRAAFFTFTCLHRFIVIAVLLEQGFMPCSIISMSLLLTPISAASSFWVNPALCLISFTLLPSIYLLFFAICKKWFFCCVDLCIWWWFCLRCGIFQSVSLFFSLWNFIVGQH